MGTPSFEDALNSVFKDFKDNSENLKNLIERLDEDFQHRNRETAITLSKIRKEMRNRYDTAMSKKGENNQEELEAIMKESEGIFLENINFFNAIKIQGSMILEMAFIYMVALFDAYLSDVLVTVLIYHPDSLKSEKQLSYKDIIEQSRAGKLISFIAQKEVGAMTYDSIQEQAEYINKKYKIRLEDSGVPLERLVVIKATRNLLVHKNGKADAKFLRANKNYSEGDRIQVTKDNWREWYSDLNVVATYLRDSLMKKFAAKPASI